MVWSTVILIQASRDTAKLCVIILTCIADDQLGNALMHDVSLSLRVPLYKVVGFGLIH